MPARSGAGLCVKLQSFAIIGSISGSTCLHDRITLQTRGELLQRMDADQDGRVSLAEYQQWLSYAFTRMDANGDSVLSPDELPGGRGKPVSLSDHRQTVAERFARQDRNRDGFLDAQELLAPPQ